MASATGRLEAVDLKSEKFRIRDDVGNAIALGHVVNAAEMAHLINPRVTATGESTRGTRGELRSLESARIEAAPLPEAWRPGQPSGWVVPVDKPGPDPDGGADLTEDEFADFLASIKGSSRPMNGV